VRHGNTGVAMYWLYQITGDTNYLAKAKAEYTWMYANDYNPATGAIEQGPGSTVYFTYDNGCWATLCLLVGDTNSANKTFDWVVNTYGNRFAVLRSGFRCRWF